MKAQNIRKKDVKSLNEDLIAKQKEVSILEFDIKIAKEKDYSRIRKMKKDIARILTIINENNTINLVEESVKIDITAKK